MCDAILDSEERSDDDLAIATITREEMDKVEREGLCDDVSLDIFLTWYTFGGISRGLGLAEIVQMPLWLRKDFRYILGALGARRRDRKRAKLYFGDEKPKKPAKGVSRNARANGAKRRR